ncbi:MAG: hypothetical protein ACRC37_04705, partial [Lentisphaeria bacterium]
YLFETWTFDAIRLSNTEIKKIHDKYPYSSDIACELFYVSKFSGGEESSDLFYRLKILLPFFSDSLHSPIIAQRAYNFFNLWINRIDKEVEKGNNLGQAMKNFFRRNDYRDFLPCKSPEDGYKLIHNLCIYFLSIIDLDNLGTSIYREKKAVENFRKKVFDAKDNMTDIVRYEAIKTLESIKTYLRDIEEKKIIEDVTNNVRNDILKNIGLNNMKNAEESKIYNKKILVDTIESFNLLKELPNDFSKLQQLLSFIPNSIKKELSSYENIPNYENLKEIYKGSNEANFLNYAFKVFVKNEYQSYLDYFDTSGGLKNNLRALKVKLYCMKELKFPYNQQLELVRRLVVLDNKDLEMHLYKTFLEFNLDKIK